MGDVDVASGAQLESGNQQRPDHGADVVVVGEAPSGRVLFSSAAADRVVGRRLADIAEEDEEFQIFRPDGRVYAAAEWPLARSLAAGEVVLDEKIYSAAGGERLRYRVNSYPTYGRDGRIVAAGSVTHRGAERLYGFTAEVPPRRGPCRGP